ncbi:MAG: hypothetical protein JXB47_21510 [Anaerolineae bacterium]|nr:hypothetical protein [Anaerolineae bacterium]
MDFFDDDDDLTFEDDDYDLDTGFDDDEDIDMDFEEEAPAGRPNRLFLIAVAVLAGLFVISICVVAGILLTRGPSADEVARLTENAMTLQAQLDATFTAAATITFGFETEQATLLTPPPTATPTPTETPTPTATLEVTEISGGVVTEEPTATPTEGPTATPIVVTATLAPSPTAGTEIAAAPTVETAAQLSNTGIMDDLGLGGGLALAGLAAFSLMAVIFVSRQLRMNRRDDEDS